MKPAWEIRKTHRKICPSVTLPTTYPALTDLVLNPGLRCESPSTNILLSFFIFFYFLLVLFYYFVCFLQSWKYAHLYYLPSKCTLLTGQQHRRTNSNIHALSRIRSHDLCIQTFKTHVVAVFGKNLSHGTANRNSARTEYAYFNW